MRDYGPAPDASERVTTGLESPREQARPQLVLFVLFGVNVVIHLAGDWDTTDTIGAGLGLASTLGLVFSSALRRNRLFRVSRALSYDPARLRRRGVFLTCVAWGWGGLFAFLLFVALVVSLPHGTDVPYAGFVLVVALVPLLVVLARRRREARWLRLLEAGPPTRIAAAVEEAGYWDGDDRRFVRGWAMLPEACARRSQSSIVRATYMPRFTPPGRPGSLANQGSTRLRSVCRTGNCSPPPGSPPSAATPRAIPFRRPHRGSAPMGRRACG